jgi:hypothetical protein
LEITVSELQKNQSRLENRQALLAILSMETYTGFSQEANFSKEEWDLDPVFAEVTDAKVTELWKQSQDVRDWLKEYSTTKFPESKDREP